MPLNCIVCQSTDSKEFCSKDSMTYLQCIHCGHVYLNDKIDESNLIDIYTNRTSHHASNQKEDWDYSKTKAHYVYDPLLKTIEHLTKRGKLLDIGCSNGSFLSRSQERGWSGVGIDLEISSLKVAEKHNLTVFQGDLKQHSFPDNSFSAVTMWQIIEHVPDPRKTLEEITRILSPGGVLAISTPNIRSIGWKLLREDWGSIEPEAHLNLFTPKGLSKLAGNCGLKPVYISTIDLKPSTIKLFLNKFIKSDNQQQPKSVARYVSESSPNKIKILLSLRYISNLPLNLLNLGEDIYGYFIKQAA